MRPRPAPVDIQRWSEEVARDPGAPSFVPLADAYRRQGNRDAAMRVCLRGLERHPANVQAHALLAKLYLDAGEREKAFDEWGTVLRLDAGDFEGNRGMGFVHLERGDFGSACTYLERAAATRPEDVAVREALSVLRDRLGGARGQVPAAGATPDAQAAPDAQPTPDAPPMPEAKAEVSASASQTVSRDPSRLFDALREEPPFLGALIMDPQGLVLAGSLAEEQRGGAEALGAILGGAVEEAGRTAEHLRLGDWRGMLMEADAAQIHVTPIAGDLLVLLAAKPDAPVGWVLRTAARAADLGRQFAERGQ